MGTRSVDFGYHQLLGPVRCDKGNGNGMIFELKCYCLSGKKIIQSK
jgi:hypothetical protein